MPTRLPKVLLASVPIMGVADAGNRLPRLGVDPLPAVVAALTPEEKVDLVVGVGMSIAGLPLPPEMRGPEGGPMAPRVPGAGGMTHAVPRLGKIGRAHV